MNSPSILATDLDGTLIPLEGCVDCVQALQTLSRKFEHQNIELVFVTGRHLESVCKVMEDHGLPIPEWIICDVGTTVCHREGDRFLQLAPYQSHLASLVEDYPQSRLRQELSSLASLRLQEEEKQGPFKLSYYTSSSQLEAVKSKIKQRLKETGAPYSLIASVDPFNGDGLIDLLPSEVSKAYALRWWLDFQQSHRDSIVFAGDSGNDLAAFLAGYRTIVVGNTDRKIAERVRDHYEKLNRSDLLFLANGLATSGVLEGCQHFGMFE